MSTPAVSEVREPTGGSALERRALLVGVVASSMANSAVFALLAKLQDDHQLPDWGVGAIAASTFASSFVAQVGLARLADRGHTRRLLRTGLVLSALGMVGFAMSSGLAGFVVSRLTLGLGIGVFVPASRRVVVSRNPDRAGEMLGRLGSAEVAGFVGGAPFGTLLNEFFGLRAPFVVLAVVLVVAMPVIARVGEPPMSMDPPGAPLRLLVAIPGVRVSLIIGATVMLSAGVFEATWSRYLTDLGASDLTIGLLLMAFAFPFMALSGIGGRIADRFGPARSALVGLAIISPLSGIFGLVEELPALSIAVITYSVVSSMVVPGSQATMALAAPASLLATGQGLYGAVGAVVAGTAAFGSPPLYRAAGPDVLWLAVAGMSMASTGVAAWLNGGLSHSRSATTRGRG